MERPSFDEWLNSQTRFLCDVDVIRSGGEQQRIYGCSFSYNIHGIPCVFKGWYMIQDYFFVDRVAGYSNFREVI